nr:MAG TPA: hypothetical protein [Caudoviricetes sp.]
MLNANKLLRRQFVLSPRSKPKVSRFYNHTIVSPTTYKTDIQHVFEYSYECINRHEIVRIKL